ncbi:MAG: hypothetical protein AAF465_06640 [Pseudomonadota bacterium]
MALIACSRCRKQISSEASACRHCGKSLRAASEGYVPRRNFALHYLLSMVLAVAGAATYISALNGVALDPMVVSTSLFVGAIGVIWYVVARIWASIS